MRRGTVYLLVSCWHCCRDTGLEGGCLSHTSYILSQLSLCGEIFHGKWICRCDRKGASSLSIATSALCANHTLWLEIKSWHQNHCRFSYKHQYLFIEASSCWIINFKSRSQHLPASILLADLVARLKCGFSSFHFVFISSSLVCLSSYTLYHHHLLLLLAPSLSLLQCITSRHINISSPLRSNILPSLCVLITSTFLLLHEPCPPCIFIGNVSQHAPVTFIVFFISLMHVIVTI